MKILICYISYSGNTKEVAELVYKTISENNLEADIFRIGSGDVPDLSKYDLIFMGTFTWGKGGVPSELKDFIWEVGFKPKNIAIFGTGDTQFGGDDLFCNATNKLKDFFSSKYETLKIEQSPRGNQEHRVISWTEGVLERWKS